MQGNGLQWYYGQRKIFNNWEECPAAFLGRYFPRGKGNAVHKEILNFQQAASETTVEAWGRYQEMFSKCSTHGLEEWFILRNFYDGLLMTSQLDMIVGQQEDLLNHLMLMVPLLWSRSSISEPSSIKIESQVQPLEPHVIALEKLQFKLMNLATTIEGQSKETQRQINQLKMAQQTKTTRQPKKVNAVTLRYGEQSRMAHSSIVLSTNYAGRPILVGRRFWYFIYRLHGWKSAGKGSSPWFRGKRQHHVYSYLWTDELATSFIIFFRETLR